MVKGTVKFTGKLVRMESRRLLAETPRYERLVYLVNPKLALHLMDEIDKRIDVHNVREDFNGGG